MSANSKPLFMPSNDSSRQSIQFKLVNGTFSNLALRPESTAVDIEIAVLRLGHKNTWSQRYQT